MRPASEKYALKWSCHDIGHDIHHDIHHNIRTDIFHQIKRD
jgi:hypothetical protein